MAKEGGRGGVQKYKILWTSYKTGPLDGGQGRVHQRRLHNQGLGRVPLQVRAVHDEACTHTALKA